MTKDYVHMMKGSTLGDSRICLFTHATANHQNHLTFQVQLTLTRFPVILAAATGQITLLIWLFPKLQGKQTREEEIIVIQYQAVEIKIPLQF